MAAAQTPFGSAAFDLGLGDGLKTQLSDAEKERKKKLLAQQAAQAQLSGSMFGPATQTLFGMGA